MTYGRDAQPDILFQGDGLKRGLHHYAARVSCLTRNIAEENRAINSGLHDEQRKAAGRVWIAQVQAARRSAQQSVIAYRGLIAEREQTRGLGLAG